MWMMNIKDIVDKYNGNISYEMQGDERIMCRVELQMRG